MSKFDIDEALIRKLAKLLKETGLTEIEYETDDARIRVNSGASGTIVAAAPAAAPASAPAPALAPPASADGPAAGSISSPMVGTAYLSPEPNA
ncbi:MAG TPA: acetyl-CoA carboxylase biotin carboxyl carrier protein, partial [Dongiaceae bacterium]|nr:acetyl-CoA carboxylase biotin carboxyl carrier protein [Dongiaceae bacterium]